MEPETNQPTKNSIPKRLLYAAAFGALSLTAACGSQTTSTTTTTAESSPPAPATTAQPEVVPMTVHMDGELSTPTKCLRGGNRPCAALIRVEASISSAPVNADPESTKVVMWPREAYIDSQMPGNSYIGDKVDVLCWEPAELVSDYGEIVDGSRKDVRKTSDWYKVFVPSQYILNPAVKSTLQRVTINGDQGAIGYATPLWFGQGGHSSAVNRC